MCVLVLVRQQLHTRIIIGMAVLSTTTCAIKAWSVQTPNGAQDFILAQCQILIVLSIAHFGNIYEPSYPRNDNQSSITFWVVVGILAIGSMATW